MASDWVTFGAGVASGVIGAGAALRANGQTMKANLKAAREERIAAAKQEGERFTRDRRADVYARIMRLHGRILLDRPVLLEGPKEDTADEMLHQNKQNLRDLMDAIAELQVFGSRDVVKLADVLGRLIVDKREVDESAIAPAWEKLQFAIRADLEIPE